MTRRGYTVADHVDNARFLIGVTTDTIIDLTQTAAYTLSRETSVVAAFTFGRFASIARGVK